MLILFYIAAAVAILSTILMLTRLNAVHALLYLIVSLLSVAVVFYVIGAPFIAALEVIIYAGAIMVLFVFVVMLLNLGEHATALERSWLSPGMWVGPLILAIVLVSELVYLLSRAPHPAVSATQITPKQVGITLFGPYVIGVELASFLLMAALVGAFHIGRRRPARQETIHDASQPGTVARIDLVRAGSGGAAGSP